MPCLVQISRSFCRYPYGGTSTPVELEPRAGKPGARGQEAFLAAYEAGVLTRVTGDTIAMSPPFIVEKSQIDQMVTTLRDVLHKID